MRKMIWGYATYGLLAAASKASGATPASGFTGIFGANFGLKTGFAPEPVQGSLFTLISLIFKLPDLPI
jgi:hypothetical protein